MAGELMPHKKALNWTVCRAKKEHTCLLLATIMASKKKVFTLVVFRGLGSGFGGAGFYKTFLVAQYVRHIIRSQLTTSTPQPPPPHTFPDFLFISMHLETGSETLMHKCTSSLYTPVLISSPIQQSNLGSF